MILRNLSINVNVFNFCYAPEEPLQFFCSSLRLIMAQHVTKYVPSSQDCQRTYYSSLFSVYIFPFIPTCKHFCKLFPILDFILTVHSWDNVSVPPVPCGGNFISVSSTFMKPWCGEDYPGISGSHLRQGWSCLSQPPCEAQISLFWLFRAAQFLRYTNAQWQLTCGLFQTILP